MGSEYEFDVMTPKTYAFGAIMILLGVIGVYMMIANTGINPLLVIFFYSIPSNCAIALFPHEPVLFLYGKTVNLLDLSIAATLGTILAAWLDYKFFAPLLNLSYSAKYKATGTYKKAHYWFYKIPFISLVVAGFTPIPFFPFKFMVYASKYSLRKYLAAVAVGRFPRYFILAYAGYMLQVPDWVIIACFVGMILIVYHRKIFRWLAASFKMLYRALSGKKEPAAQTVPGKITLPLGFRISMRTLKNMMMRKPICIALEVTHNCTANCRHCDKGARVDDNAVGPERYAEICREISPSVIQLAGGEPLLRDDLADIVRAIYRPNKPPLLAVVTNGSLLSKDRYWELKKAGISQFSISLDFPDSRHDQFRRIPGLFEHLNRLIPELLSFGNGDVILNTCITRVNFEYLPDIVAKVSEWGAKINFSAYTDLRTQDPQYNLCHPEDTSRYKAIIEKIYSPSNGNDCVMTPKRVALRFGEFYENGCNIPNCQTGRRFLIVNPDGRLTPCAMFIDERYDSVSELVEKFVKKRDCGGCYIAIRANTEKGPVRLLTDNLRIVRRTIWSMKKHAESKTAGEPIS